MAALSSVQQRRLQRWRCSVTGSVAAIQAGASGSNPAAAAIFFGLFLHKLFTRLGIRLGLGLGLVIFVVRDSFSILSLRFYRLPVG